jgi:hypothetical protein
MYLYCGVAATVSAVWVGKGVTVGWVGNNVTVGRAVGFTVNVLVGVALATCLSAKVEDGTTVDVFVLVDVIVAVGVSVSVVVAVAIAMVCVGSKGADCRRDVVPAVYETITIKKTVDAKARRFKSHSPRSMT